MLYLIDSEFAVHQCHNAKSKTVTARKEMSKIAGNPYSRWTAMYTLSEDRVQAQIMIRYCPYCGCDLDKEEISPEQLETRYLARLWVLKYRT